MGALAGRTQAALLAVSGPEPEPEIVDGVRSFERDDWSRDEIAAALGISTRAAGSAVQTARVLGRCLDATQARLDAGEISWRHAQTLVDECAGLPDWAVRAVEARVIQRAPQQTVANFKRSVRRAVHAVADTDAQLAEAVAKTERCVWLRPEPDGMATLGAFLPAIEAHAAYQLIDRSAKRIAAAGGKVGNGAKAAPKPLLDESRADAFLALLGVEIGVGRAASSLLRRSRDVNARNAADRIARASGGDGITSRHRRRLGRLGWVGGLGRLAGQAPGRSSDVAISAGPVTASLDADSVPDAGSVPDAAVGVGVAAAVSVELQIVIDAATLAGLSDNPAELVGYGPISSLAARDLFAQLADDVRLRRLVTDPIVGHLLDYGRSTYRIPKPLADFVRARDRQCRFPGCLRPATACDVDHVISWNDGGKTSASNCACLCRRHHRLKTHGGWEFELHTDGSCVWTSPAGQRYALEPPTQF